MTELHAHRRTRRAPLSDRGRCNLPADYFAAVGNELVSDGVVLPGLGDERADERLEVGGHGQVQEGRRRDRRERGRATAATAGRRPGAERRLPTRRRPRRLVCAHFRQEQEGILDLAEIRARFVLPTVLALPLSSRAGWLKLPLWQDCSRRAPRLH